MNIIMLSLNITNHKENMNYNFTKILCLFFLGLNFHASSQNVVEVTFIERRTKENISAAFGVAAQFDVKLYKMLYETPDIQGNLDTASGLFIIPDDPTGTFPLLSYSHGTVNDRNDVPSLLEGGSELAIVFGSIGYVTTAADFLGLGTARGIHPYVHADSEASASIDMMYAMRTYAGTDPAITLNDQVFITGYSQGGHAAMATHRKIEQDLSDDFTVTATAPMSGPYSISQEMRIFTTGDDPYLFVGYLGSLVLSYQAAYGNIYSELEDIFKPGFAADIRSFENEEITLLQLTLQLGFKLQLQGGVIPKNMLQDDIREIVVNDGEHPLMDALRDNDVFDWAPTAPTRLFYCMADDQVTFRNAILADSVMNANGAIDLEAIDVNSLEDHGGCVNPATRATIAFFAQFQEVAVGTNEVFTQDLFEVYPNPASEILTIQMETARTDVFTVQLFDVYGKLVKTEVASGNSVALEVGGLPVGMYLLSINDGTVRGVEKINIQR